MNEVLEIHKYIFNDMHYWAGQFRKVNIAKEGNAFMPIQSFNKGVEYLNSLITKFHNTADCKKAVAKQLAEILDNLNYFHPF